MLAIWGPSPPCLSQMRDMEQLHNIRLARICSNCFNSYQQPKNKPTSFRTSSLSSGGMDKYYILECMPQQSQGVLCTGSYGS